MAIVSPPKLGQPYWTAFSPVEGDSSPVDPLRFETYAERLGNDLFPGITNRVERVRYFGMVCAGIQAAGAELAGAVTGREYTRLVRQRFTKFEAAWAFSQLAAQGRDIKERPAGVPQPRLKYEFRGFRGANRALAYWTKTRDDDTINGRSGYRLLQAQESQGGLGAYAVSLREHGFVHADRLDVTAAGAALALAFYDGTQRKTKEVLAVDGRPSRAAWAHAGERYALHHPTTTECRLVGDAVFSEARTLGRFVNALPPELRRSAMAKEAFEFIADSGTQHAEAAKFTLAFDDLRRASLRLFAAVGNALRQAVTPQTIAQLLPADELSSLSLDVQRSATVAAQLQAPPGLAPISSLAVELRGVKTSEVVASLVAFHRREGRRWIELVGTKGWLLNYCRDVGRFGCGAGEVGQHVGGDGR